MSSTFLFLFIQKMRGLKSPKYMLHPKQGGGASKLTDLKNMKK